ncbi:MAG: ATP-binding cassette domain-containing protein [Lachnospiraceae bacterium]|nr:ATP-binding cassette domain-containing protein [Lachnospiraceae bacterium]
MSVVCKIKKKAGHFSLDVEFEIENETLAIIGVSGSGKSMTLRCIAGIEKPDNGIIKIDGRTVFDSEKGINLPPQKRHAGYLFQDFALFPNMTVSKNILTVMPKDKRDQLDSVITSLHLNGLENHYPSQLSGGQKQRCALARMIASEPEIIMLDEPFSSLDSHLKWQMELEVTSIIKKIGKTVLFVSHDRDEVYRISDRVLVIENGRSENIKEKQDLYQKPRTYSDALLTGCKNILPVKYENGFIQTPGYGIQIPVVDHEKGYSYLGIRAKQMIPAHDFIDCENAYLFEYQIESVIESVFTMILMIRINGAENQIRWEISKKEYILLKNYPKIIAIPKDKVMLLAESAYKC